MEGRRCCAAVVVAQVEVMEEDAVSALQACLRQQAWEKELPAAPLCGELAVRAVLEAFRTQVRQRGESACDRIQAGKASFRVGAGVCLFWHQTYATVAWLDKRACYSEADMWADRIQAGGMELVEEHVRSAVIDGATFYLIVLRGTRGSEGVMEGCRGRNGIPAGFMDPVGVAVFNIWDGFVYAFLEERLRNRVLVRLR